MSIGNNPAARLLRFVLILALGLAALWAAGLAVFVHALPGRAEADRALAEIAREPRLGIAVLTGGGGLRIADGMAIFASGTGDRLLISGVHEAITAADLKKFWPGASARFTCCVDLGRAAKSTRGNALEIARWARKHRFAVLVIVTSDYHLPRAMHELKQLKIPSALLAMPTPSTGLAGAGWPVDGSAWRRVAGEYSKFLAARVFALVEGAPT
ncbi:MAG: YdcF family protein [Pseudomonadota bacterium]